MELITRQNDWDTLLAPTGHLLQSWNWGELKSAFGWEAVRVKVGANAAQILFKRLPLGFSVAYVPKGPSLNWQNRPQVEAMLAALHTLARQRRAIFLKIEPDAWLSAADSPTPAVDALTQAGFRPADTIQPQTTLLVNLAGSDDSTLAAMKQKTRYNIRYATRKGVTVREGTTADLPTFHELSRLTAQRDGFGIHTLSYYQAAFKLFAPAQCALLIAEYTGEPLAALMVFCQGEDAAYFYGASSNEQRHLMPTYLLQWEAMRWAKQRGCTRYDLWGIPNADPDTLEAEFTRRSEGLWGVYRFKRGFGGQVYRSVGAFDFVYNPLLYQLYRLRRRE